MIRPIINAHERTVEIVVAVDTAGGFSKDGTLPPWDVPEDLPRFRQLTDGGVCIMGKYTYVDMINIKKARKKDVTEDQPPKPLLAGRESFVISSDPKFDPVGATGATSLSHALNQLDHEDLSRVFILGGHRLFIEALGRGCIVHITVVKGDPYNCDQFFPIEALNSSYEIVGGEETEKCYHMTYHPKPRQLTEAEMWEQFIRENFRPVHAGRG